MGGDLVNKLKKILACMIITLGILYLPEIHANASTVTIDEATFPDSCVIMAQLSRQKFDVFIMN